MNIQNKINKSVAALRVIKIMKNWPDYFKEFFGLKKNKELVYKLRNGINLYLKYHELNRRIFNEIWIYECYNPKGFEIKPDDIVLDIGANYGNFAVYAAAKAKKGKVFAFEPVKENFDILVRNTKANKLSNIIPINEAVAEKSGVREIFTNDESDCNDSFFSDIARAKETKSRKIKTISLREFLSKNKINRINFLKLDCEGAEYEILFTSKELLGKIDKLSAEIHYLDEKRNVLVLKKFLEDNGFEVRIEPNCETKFVNLLYAMRRV